MSGVFQRPFGAFKGARLLSGGWRPRLNANGPSGLTAGLAPGAEYGAPDEIRSRGPKGRRRLDRRTDRHFADGLPGQEERPEGPAAFSRGRQPPDSVPTQHRAPKGRRRKPDRVRSKANAVFLRPFGAFGSGELVSGGWRPRLNANGPSGLTPGLRPGRNTSPPMKSRASGVLGTCARVRSERYSAVGLPGPPGEARRAGGV